MGEGGRASRPLSLPHGGPARLVTRVLARGEGSATCAARVPAASAFAVFGRAPAFLALEMAAQATAALQDLGEGGGEPAWGYLVGIRDARFAVATIAVEEEHVVEVRLAGEAPPLWSCEVRVADAAGGEIARATLSMYAPGARRNG